MEEKKTSLSRETWFFAISMPLLLVYYSVVSSFNFSLTKRIIIILIGGAIISFGVAFVQMLILKNKNK